MDEQIINIIKSDEDMYNIYKCIVSLENEHDKFPENFNSVDSTVDTISRIFSDPFINNSRKDIYDGIRILNFSCSNREYAYKFLILTRYFETFNDKINDKTNSGICIGGCTFEFDSSATMIVGCKKMDPEDMRANFDKINEKLRKYIPEKLCRRPNNTYYM
mgnify:CR=1 FL=1